ncbi:hypothetical protein G5B37_12085 [Rasiella rasia]|uniref:Uncharacterized protein n=1 Tax=Rasiella rasia TaxID=2744027 RepID=A0A6G6GPB4_9FLAO|nr:hypothetical protein [Rasiella rasia]QIE60273.1 hypothetical protein G5B37_12085 [Rasiella rasia]
MKTAIFTLLCFCTLACFSQQLDETQKEVRSEPVTKEMKPSSVNSTWVKSNDISIENSKTLQIVPINEGARELKATTKTSLFIPDTNTDKAADKPLVHMTTPASERRTKPQKITPTFTLLKSKEHD